MSNQQVKLGLVALTLVAVLVFASAVLPAANALTPSTITNSRGHKTDRFPGGQHICGDKLCSAQEWSKMKKDLHTAQSDPVKCSQLKAWTYCGQPVMTPKTTQ